METAAGHRDERQLIASILNGETHLFHELIRPYERSVYLMALSFLHNEADAEDVVQEAFLKAYRHLSTFRGESRFSTWLLSIALNEARSRLRRTRTARTESLEQSSGEEGYPSPAWLRDWREIPSEALQRMEIRRLLYEAVDTLPPIYREIFLLRDVEELSVAEVAELLQITEVMVKVRLHRARTMLQKKLAPHLLQTIPQRSSRRRWFPWP
jgi:RNA polymerase sigma-70 factor, ECF subfamily